MISVLKEECKKVGLEKHNVKTQVLTNGIKEHCDDRRLILKHFNDKVKVDKKTKEYRKQSKLEKQRNKCKKKPNKREQAHTAPVKTKKKISKKKPLKNHYKVKANSNDEPNKERTKENDTDENNTKRHSPKAKLTRPKRCC